MIRLCDGLFLVGSGALGFDLTHPSDCHVYLVAGDGESALIDAGAGMDPDAVLANIAATGTAPEEITRLFLTHAHADHAGGAAVLRERLPRLRVTASVPVADIVSRGDEELAGVACGKAAGAYTADYRYRACPVDDIAADGQTLTVGGVTLTAVHTPGHSTGHTCYLAALGGHHVLFSGDHLFCGGRIALQNIWDCRVDDYVASLRKLADLRADRLMPGHLGISMSAARRHIDLALAALRGGLLPPSIV